MLGDQHINGDVILSDTGDDDDIESLGTEEEQWNQIMVLLKDVRTQCLKQATINRSLSNWLRQINNGVSIPMIILAYVNSVLIAGALNDSMSPGTLSILTCVISMVAGILQSVVTFMKVPDRLAAASQLYVKFNALAHSLNITLDLPYNLRQVTPSKYTLEVTDQFNQLMAAGEVPRYE
uniref:VP11 n=1 Tax=viral metagenome TaxID=1070528 RepID=A0A2V0RB20_9ZZZZ